MTSCLSALAIVSCVPAFEIPGATLIDCNTTDDCPAGMQCVVFSGQCQRSENIDTSPPVASEIALEPDIGRRSTTFVVRFELDEPTLTDPLVRLGDDTVFSVNELETDRPAHEWAYHYIVTGAEAEGDLLVGVRAIDRSGNELSLTVGTIAIDMTAPTVTIAWVPDAGRTAITSGDQLSIAGVTDDPTASLTSATLWANDLQLIDLTDATEVNATAITADRVLTADELAGVSEIVVEVILVDPAGNPSEPRLSRSLPIPVDLDAPTDPIISVRGKPVTSAQVVIVDVAATGATEVVFGGDVIGGGEWIETALPAAISVTLTPGLADKTVTATFRDGAGNESVAVSDVITYNPNDDQDGPVIVSIDVNGPQSIDVVFDEPLRTQEAEDPTAYQAVQSDGLVPPLFVDSATLDATAQVVSLGFAAPSAPGLSYTLWVTGVTDLVGNLNDPTVGAVFTGFGVTTAPDPIAPADGATRVVGGGSLRLAWTDRLGATYDLEIYGDEALTSLALAVTDIADTYYDAMVAAGATYWWRVAAVMEGVPGPFSAPRAVGVIDDVVRVFCDDGTGCPGGMGTTNRPYGSVREALELGFANPSSALDVRIASDGDTVYPGSVALPPGTRLLGGYDPSFDDATRDWIAYPATIASDSFAALTITNVTAATPTVVEGLIFEGLAHAFSTGIIVAASDEGLTIRDCVANAAMGTTTRGIMMTNSGSGLGIGPRLERLRAVGGSGPGLGQDTAGAEFVDSYPVLVDSVFVGGDPQSGSSSGALVFGGGPTISGGQLIGGPATTSSTGLDIRGAATVIVDGARIESTAGGTLQWSRGVYAVSSRIVLTSSAVTAGEASLHVYGVYLAGDEGAESILSNNTIVAVGKVPGPSSGTMALWANNSPDTRITNNILIASGDRCASARQDNSARPGSVQNNLLTGCLTLWATTQTTSCPGAQCFTDIAAVNDASVTTAGLPASSEANIGPETVADPAAVFFINEGARDYHLTASTPLAILRGGRDTGQLNCGPQSDDDCGGVTADADGDPRPGGDGDYAIGAFEP